MAKMRIIGTGLTGMVGSRVVELLSSDYSFLNLSFPDCDILDFKKLDEIFKKEDKARIVLHLAAFTDVKLAWRERGNKKGLCFKINVLGTQNLAKLCRKYGKHLIFISTDFVFNGQKKTFYTEKDKPDPIEWYGQTKFLAEEEVKKNCFQWAIVRIAFPYRARFEAKIDLTRRIIQSLKEKNLYPMFADQLTTPTFIDEIVFGLEKFFKNRPQGIYHLVASSYQSPYKMALQVAEVFGFDRKLVKEGSLAEYKKSQSKDSRPWHQNLALSSQKVRKELSIRMSTLSQG